MLDLPKVLSKFKFLLPPLYYKEWVDHFNRMIVHTRKKKPSEVLLKIRPNEQPDVHTYRLENYREITYSSMIKSFDRLFRIFNGVNFSWEASDGVKEYIQENKFQKNSFEQFMSQIVLKNTIDDPNGLLVWLPDGEGLDDKSKKQKPRPEIVQSEDIRVFDDELLIYKSHIDAAKYIQISEDTKLYESYVVLTKNTFGYFFYFQDDAKDFFQPIYSLVGFDELPVIVLGGIDVGGYYESFFSPFLAYGDEAIARFSDWQGVTVMCGYPQIDELEEECDHKGCNGGVIGRTKDGHKKYCPTCHGTGIKPNKGPFNVYKRRKPDPGETDETISIASRRFNHPETSILDTMDKNWKGLVDMGEDALRLVYTKVAQSGVAKDIDREDGDSTINKISDRHFDIHWYYSLKYIGMYLNPGRFDTKNIKITKPVSFRLRTVSDLLDEIATLKEKNAPIIIILNVVRELFNKRFNYDQVSKKIFEVIFENDPLSVYSVLESQSLIMSNSIQPEQMTNNLFLFQTLLKISQEMTPGVFIGTANDILFQKAKERMKDFYTKPINPIAEV